MAETNPKLIDVLLKEHRNIKRLLLILEQELAVFDRRERPDYEVWRAIIQYFQDFPEHCHHPKEDMLYAKLKARDTAAAAPVGDVEAEHFGETERLHRFAEAVESILSEQEVLRERVHQDVRDFIEHQRQHMDKEERLLFPAAVKALRADDWKAIDARLGDRKDPLFDGSVDKKFQALQRKILRWEREAEAARA
jgi:hemerythrin-like domain-containing protein